MRLLAITLASALLLGCGGGNDGTAEVFKVVPGDGATDIPGATSPSDLLGFDVLHRMQLAAVGVTVESSICHTSANVIVGIPDVLYVYLIPVEHVPAAVSIGFQSALPSGFSSTSRPCFNPPPILPV